MSAPYPILHPCHRSPNRQCCAADGGLICGERKSLLERVQYVALQDVYIHCVCLSVYRVGVLAVDAA